MEKFHRERWKKREDQLQLFHPVQPSPGIKHVNEDTILDIPAPKDMT